MKPTRQPVEPIDGEPLRFRVKSRSRHAFSLLVDLETDECGCEDFQFRVSPARAKGESVRRCWHLEEARNYLLDVVISEMAQCSRERYPVSKVSKS